MKNESTRNVFISHHHKDDASVDGLTSLLKPRGHNLRNSSIRAKPENQRRLRENKVSDNVIRRLLRMKMKWAGQVIVIIGKKTHTRPWVKWEIELARKLGKPIIGVYEHGLKDKVKIPDALEKYGDAIVAWNHKSITDAIDGESRFENPDGTPRPNVHGGNTQC